MIGVGTDTGMTFVPQYATWRELELLVAYAGFSPAEALHAVTAVNASILASMPRPVLGSRQIR